MRQLEVRLDELDAWTADGMYKYGRVALRISLAAVFIWFGTLKPLGLSPAEELVRHTVYWMDPGVFVPLLGYWEIAIGVDLLVRPFIRVSLFLLAVQMPGTLMPLFLLPDICFTQIPFGLTLEGQYIIKNVTLISAAIVVGGTVRHQSDGRKIL